MSLAVDVSDESGTPSLFSGTWRVAEGGKLSPMAVIATPGARSRTSGDDRSIVDTVTGELDSALWAE